MASTPVPLLTCFRIFHLWCDDKCFLLIFLLFRPRTGRIPLSSSLFVHVLNVNTKTECAGERYRPSIHPSIHPSCAPIIPPRPLVRRGADAGRCDCHQLKIISENQSSVPLLLHKVGVQWGWRRVYLGGGGGHTQPVPLELMIKSGYLVPTPRSLSLSLSN